MDLPEINTRIQTLRNRLNALRPLLPEQERRIMDKFRLDWNYHSNSLEGNQLTYGETRVLLLYGITAQGKPLKDHLEIKGHNEAIHWIEEVIRQERPLTENFIRELHQLLLKEPYQVDAITPDGQPTKRWIQIGGYKTTTNHVKTVTGEIFYFATPEETPAKMHDLLEWYRSELTSKTLEPPVLAALFHYQFIRIHPFDDGNGRIARILMNFILLQHRLPPVIIKTGEKEAYFSALRQADGDNLEAFVNYIGEQLIHSLDLMIKGAEGGNMEEESDLDKKIALLKARLNQKEEVQSKKSLEVVQDLFRQSLKPLFEALEFKLSKFNEFFHSVNIDYGINDHKIPLKSLQKIILQTYHRFSFRLSAEKEFNRAGEVLESFKFIRMNYQGHGFKKAGTQTFNTYMDLGINFDDYKYVIISAGMDSNSNNPLIEKLYHQQLTAQEIKDLAGMLADQVYKNIERNAER